jgi:hypothetical protein
MTGSTSYSTLSLQPGDIHRSKKKGEDDEYVGYTEMVGCSTRFLLVIPIVHATG